MSYTSLLLSESEARGLASRFFDINGTATPLPGEIDINFRITVSDSETYTLKISRPGVDENYLDFQYQLAKFASRQQIALNLPLPIPTINGTPIASFVDAGGRERYIRMLKWIPGRPWSQVNPQTDALLFSLGRACGKLTASLQGFEHAFASRKLHWDIAQGLWARDYLYLFNGSRKAIITQYLNAFTETGPGYSQLRKSVVHNDANDLNIIVSEDLAAPEVKALIDFGDAVYTQTINDLAVACAYAIMHKNDPLQACEPIIRGYHEAFPLQEEELDYLYIAIAMRLVISATKSAINLQEEPENEYLQVSDAPVWALLYQWQEIHPDFARITFRAACGFIPHPKQQEFEAWAGEQQYYLTDLFPLNAMKEVLRIDLSVGSTWLGLTEDAANLDKFQYRIETLQKEHPGNIPAGGYLEARNIYTTTAYEKNGNNGPETRSIHLGVDFWLPANTPVHAILDGEVVIAVNDAGDKEYGGLIVLKHRQQHLEFYTLYGHLTVESATSRKKGEVIKSGQLIGLLGNFPENGNWAPHLHFQVLLSLLDRTDDFPGVTYPSQRQAWKSLCPDPNLLFKLKGLEPPGVRSENELIRFRRRHLGRSLSLQYGRPLKIVRGAGPYLVDHLGRKYLDTVNNVAHVGHEHPAVVRAGQGQMAVLNTNTRYLHDNILELTEELLAKLPPELSVLHFVNSGSEANELAMRMAMAATGERDFIASEAGYHGNTHMCVSVSSYKFDGAGGSGAPEHTHVFPLPDAFRGRYRGKDSGPSYAGELQKLLQKVHDKERGIAALILEPIISCGGQVELPPGFLPAAYRLTREAGGLCISDEVQVGCGRPGKTFWGFQLHGVLPDIVTIGKPLGNGHPLAAVACTPEVADAFANGMEYFNTFGGNPVSCAIGTAVLRTLRAENLQENALETGNYLKAALKNLSESFPIIGDVRGQGLFLGVELVGQGLNPLARQATYLVNRMKDHGILMSIDGPDHNVLKIKPPMVFAKKHADELLYYLERVMKEDVMRTVKT